MHGFELWESNVYQMMLRYKRWTFEAWYQSKCTKYTICNTLGVCHQLSNGFELKHDMLSGHEGVKIKSTSVSSNVNLGNTPLLAYWPFFDIHLSNVEGASFMCLTSIFHPHGWLEKFREVWNREVTWNDKLCPGLNCFIRWMRTCDDKQTLQTCSNNSMYTHE